jgi:hypothetical protein
VDILRALGPTLQLALGPELDRLGRDTGAIRRRRRFSGATLLKTLVVTLLKAPAATHEDYAVTAATLGVPVTPRAVEKRFTPALVAFLRAALERLLPRALAAAPVAVPLLRRFTAVYVGDATTVPLPEACAAEFPGCGGKSGGRAAVKIQVLWELITGRLERLLLEPGRAGDATSAAVPAAPPPGSLSLYDLGYLELARLGRWAAAGAYWITRWPQGTAAFDADGRRLELPVGLARHPGGGPFDRPVTVGVDRRLAGRLVALPAPAEVAARRRQRAYARARKHGRAPTAEHLTWCDWTAFLTNCPAELLSIKEVVVLYRTRWQVELLFRLWKSDNRLASGPPSAAPARRTAELWAKLIGVVVQHWLLLATAWPEVRRSLRKAARLIRDRAGALWEALEDPAGLAAELAKLGAVIALVARVTPRRKHPSWFQLLLDPELLEWEC